MIIRACYKSRYESRMSKRVHREASRLELKRYDWYSWRGFTLPDAIELAYAIHQPSDRGFNPERGVAFMEAAHRDLHDAIPKSVAAALLGFSTPEFRKGTYYKNGAEELPFNLHPRLTFYPWIRTSLTTRKEVKELLDSGKYQLHPR